MRKRAYSDGSGYSDGRESATDATSPVAAGNVSTWSEPNIKQTKDPTVKKKKKPVIHPPKKEEVLTDIKAMRLFSNLTEGLREVIAAEPQQQKQRPTATEMQQIMQQRMQQFPEVYEELEAAQPGAKEQEGTMAPAAEMDFVEWARQRQTDPRLRGEMRTTDISPAELAAEMEQMQAQPQAQAPTEQAPQLQTQIPDLSQQPQQPGQIPAYMQQYLQQQQQQQPPTFEIPTIQAMRLYGELTDVIKTAVSERRAQTWKEPDFAPRLQTMIEGLRAGEVEPTSEAVDTMQYMIQSGKRLGQEPPTDIAKLIAEFNELVGSDQGNGWDQYESTTPLFDALRELLGDPAEFMLEWPPPPGAIPEENYETAAKYRGDLRGAMDLLEKVSDEAMRSGDQMLAVSAGDRAKIMGQYLSMVGPQPAMRAEPMPRAPAPQDWGGQTEVIDPYEAGLGDTTVANRLIASFIREANEDVEAGIFDRLREWEQAEKYPRRRKPRKRKPSQLERQRRRTRRQREREKAERGDWEPAGGGARIRRDPALKREKETRRQRERMEPYSFWSDPFGAGWEKFKDVFTDKSRYSPEDERRREIERSRARPRRRKKKEKPEEKPLEAVPVGEEEWAQETGELPEMTPEERERFYTKREEQKEQADKWRKKYEDWKAEQPPEPSKVWEPDPGRMVEPEVIEPEEKMTQPQVIEPDPTMERPEPAMAWEPEEERDPKKLMEEIRQDDIRERMQDPKVRELMDEMRREYEEGEKPEEPKQKKREVTEKPAQPKRKPKPPAPQAKEEGPPATPPAEPPAAEMTPEEQMVGKMVGPREGPGVRPPRGKQKKELPKLKRKTKQPEGYDWSEDPGLLSAEEEARKPKPRATAEIDAVNNIAQYLQTMGYAADDVQAQQAAQRVWNQTKGKGMRKERDWIKKFAENPGRYLENYPERAQEVLPLTGLMGREQPDVPHGEEAYPDFGKAIDVPGLTYEAVPGKQPERGRAPEMPTPPTRLRKEEPQQAPPDPTAKIGEPQAQAPAVQLPESMPQPPAEETTPPETESQVSETEQQQDPNWWERFKNWAGQWAPVMPGIFASRIVVVNGDDYVKAQLLEGPEWLRRTAGTQLPTGRYACLDLTGNIIAIRIPDSYKVALNDQRQVPKDDIVRLAQSGAPTWKIAS